MSTSNGKTAAGAAAISSSLRIELTNSRPTHDLIEDRSGGLGLDVLVDDVDGPALGRPSLRLVETEGGVEVDVAGVDGAERRRHRLLTAETIRCPTWSPARSGWAQLRRSSS